MLVSPPTTDPRDHGVLPRPHALAPALLVTPLVKGYATRMINLRAALLTLSLLGLAGVAEASQPRLAVLPMSGVNIHPGYLDAARDILKDHLMTTGKFYVIGVPGKPADQEYSTAQAQELGRSVQADMVVTTHIVHLAGTARVRMTVWRVGDGTIAHSDSMTTAGGPDDLDPVLKRLAMGFATGKPVSQTGEIDSVTQKESDPYLKQTATKIFGLRLGGIMPLNRLTDETTTATGLGLFWMYDARDFIAEIWADFYRGSTESISMFNVGIGGYYPFTRKNISPYVGMGAAWSNSDFSDNSGSSSTDRFTAGEDPSASGMRLNAAFGMLMGRLWTVQVRAELGWFANLYGQKNFAGNKTRYSHGPMLTLALGI
jgi:hypothetical protein